jgi:hypothetical protein
VAHGAQASDPRNWRDCIEGVGKWRLSGSGKYPVNKDAEGFLLGFRFNTGQWLSVIASEAKQSISPPA